VDQNKFTDKVQEALMAAKEIAVRFGNTAVDVEHVLLALIQDKDGFVPIILDELGTDKDKLAEELYRNIESFPKANVTEDSQFYITNRLNSLFLRAENEAKAFNDEYISTEHLFLASIQDSELSRIYQRYGITYDKAAAVIQKIRGGKKIMDRNPEDKYKVLENMEETL